ncbi:MAG TPA: delta-60 repeat domain-containing protein [Burkholderiales bacterium]|nr:delta-60 repeat domain-containing protein [Burkholderiales bacterium]
MTDVDLLSGAAAPVSNSAPTFTVGEGKLSTELGTSNDRATDIVVQPDGKILVAGHVQNGPAFDIALVRYNADGSLDTTFAGDGSLVVPAGSTGNPTIVLQPDGRFLVAATGMGAGNADFMLVRFNADGSPDTSFDGDGKVTTDFGGRTDSVSDVLLQADGKVIVAGNTTDGFNGDYALARYNADGTLDATFGVGGKITTALSVHTDLLASIALQSDGRIVAVGSSWPSFLTLVHYNADGSLDTTLDGDGSLLLDVASHSVRATDLVLQPDGTIVVLGHHTLSFAAARRHDRRARPSHPLIRQRFRSPPERRRESGPCVRRRWTRLDGSLRRRSRICHRQSARWQAYCRRFLDARGRREPPRRASL